MKGSGFIEDSRIDQMIAEYPEEVSHTRIIKEFKSFFVMFAPAVKMNLKDCSDCYTTNENESK